MKKMRRYRDFLIEELADRDEALSFLEVALEEYEKDGYGDVLYLAYETAIKAQGGVQKFALKTHSTPQAVSDALLSKDETQIAELLKKQILARREKDTDIAQNGPLPKGWREVALGEFMEFKNGLNTRKENYGSGVKFVNVMDVFGHNRLYATDVIGSVQVNEKQRVDYSVKYGDVLFNRTSETVEEIAMSSVYLDKKEIIFGGFVIRGRQKTNILIPEYSAYCFQAHTVRRELIRRGQGAVRANIGQKDLSKIPMAIPPVNEQKAIASLLAKWDTAIEKTETLIEAQEKRFKWLLKTLISDQQDNHEWRQVKLGEICKVFKGQGLSKNSIRENGKNKCILYGQLYTVYPEIIDKVISKTDINKGISSKIGDILIPGSTTTKGIDLANATALFEENVLLGGDINILRVLKENVYDSSFLAYQLTHSKKREIARYTQGITIVHLYGKDLRNLNLSLPDIKKQRQIVKTLNTAQKEITLLNRFAEQYRTQKRELMQKLLTGKWRIRNQNRREK